MNELMLHVEKIVRPVSATQGRKLRMRAELLAHLQAALDEERKHFPSDDAAWEQAKLRLGDPVELTRQLQQTVPALESVLLARFVLPPRINRMEQKMARVPGKSGPMTLGHIVILSTMATLLCAPLFASMHSALASSDMQTQHILLGSVGTPVGAWALLFLAYHFVFSAAAPDRDLDGASLLKRGATILGLQIGLSFFVVFAVVNRCATPVEIATCTVSSVALLMASALIARRIGVLRRPYDEWLSLDLAG